MRPERRKRVNGLAWDGTVPQASRGGLGASAGRVKLWVGSNGLPLEVESDATGRMMGFGGRTKATILYEDYGAPVRITAPM